MAGWGGKEEVGGREGERALVSFREPWLMCMNDLPIPSNVFVVIHSFYLTQGKFRDTWYNSLCITISRNISVAT